MKKIILLLAVFGIVTFSSCEGPEGPPGQDGFDGQDGQKGEPGFVSEVFELRNINFSLDPNNGYIIYQKLNPVLYNGDVLLIYRLAGTIDSATPIWQQIPRTLFLTQGELDYDFDFSKEDFTIYAGGTYNLSTTPSYINNQTFRIVIVPGPATVTGKSASTKVDLSDYNAVIKAYNIDDSKVKVLN
ncbi:collagen-like protein [Flavobacterium sp. 5]|uniref:collagen-like triple helix repeat-containing protein n=1 Tax=Flavobacterium sp. 5 TaxID=2035199 RepID=UPI000C2C589C|nr:collagen-like protein [Flavobacterium sp. 5]PKB15639.1 hypothetical protein CLU82_0724 [Flavobacterium sp. 5]